MSHAFSGEHTGDPTPVAAMDMAKQSEGHAAGEGPRAHCPRRALQAAPSRLRRTANGMWPSSHPRSLSRAQLQGGGSGCQAVRPELRASRPAKSPPWASW